MSRATALAVALLAALLALTSCSTVPSASPVVEITQAPARVPQAVGIEPLPPEAGASAEEIVRDFINAAASTVRRHPVARQYLTPEADQAWDPDESGISVIGTDLAVVTTDAGAVTVTANLIGTVDPRGIFTAAERGLFTRTFSLQQVDGEWRISTPPDGLIMLEPDFRRLYDGVAAYFLDWTGQRVVPDPRYLIRGDSQPTALVERLIAGPSAPLAAGVRNPLSEAELVRGVTVQGQTATVELTGLPAEPAPLLAEISAQLVWNLQQLDRPRISNVVVLLDGEPVTPAGVPVQQTVEDWASFDPDAAPVDGVGHYIDAGAVKTVAEGQPVPGPAGTGEYGLTSAAIAADSASGQLSFLTGVRTDAGGATLLAGDYGGGLTEVLRAGTLSAPTVAATRTEAWVVRDGAELVRIPKGGPPQPVAAPTLPGLGRTEVLQLSPDGVRAAVVVDGPQGRRLHVGTVVRSEDGAVVLRDLRNVAPTLAGVIDVGWRDSGNLLVLAGDEGEDRIVPYSVGVDGWGLTLVPTSGLPSQPTALGVAPLRQPLVSAGDTVWQLAGGTWVTLVRGAEPLPGTAPFYPL
ncbi:LpqB family beta-propeller domain-containing protein [Blastococcus sp. VKM Ac-2987]|uniref:LpqB family beta-propeller domain-containing protein n=1 Tax=Blastococcus sp. VKM Ac-2987 TaxID=3004141 RepID=UPI0022AB55ED|nr:LpqB family beta-propeller domain-containing protein [Blastococcus sp. VKM Ac-2987]MCZ2859590.1 LpqB family beta-propeller domain-containing protein [Blastococcus sp. VKM Ac-2987]